MTNTLNKLGTEGNLLSLIKGMHENPTAKIEQFWKTGCFPLDQEQEEETGSHHLYLT